jgi:hypothetical protein
VITGSSPSPLSTPNLKDVRRVDRTQIADDNFLKKDLFDHKVFAPQREFESFQVIPEEFLFPILLSSGSQIEHKTEDVNKQNHSFFLDIKKRNYQEKKIGIDLNFKKKSDLEYAKSIDYCHMSFYS